MNPTLALYLLGCLFFFLGLALDIADALAGDREDDQ